VRAHLLPAQLIRREFPYGLATEDGGRSWRRADRLEGYPRRPVREVVWDPRVWVPACGGPTGVGGHHGRFDYGSIRLERAELPAGVEEFAAVLGLSWWLDRTYGEVAA
jgi:hypothetical protein